MLAARMYGVNDLRVEEIPTPSAGPGEILIKVKAAAICGTDVRMLTNGAKGINEDKAREMIIMGFIDEFREELPMEYAVELNKLLKNKF